MSSITAEDKHKVSSLKVKVMFLKINGLWLRIAGQVIAFLTLIFLLLTFVDQRIPDFSKGEGTELVLLIPFLGITILGYVLAYFYPSKGGTMLITGGVLMMTCHLLFSNYTAALIFGLPFIVAGALILVAAKNSNSQDTE